MQILNPGAALSCGGEFAYCLFLRRRMFFRQAVTRPGLSSGAFPCLGEPACMPCQDLPCIFYSRMPHLTMGACYAPQTAVLLDHCGESMQADANWCLIRHTGQGGDALATDSEDCSCLPGSEFGV